MTRKIRKIFVITILLFTLVPIFSFGTEEAPSLSCKAAILVDSKTGAIIYEKNSEKQMTPASITKIMTAILVLETLDMDKEITIKKEHLFPYGNTMELRVGEKFTVEELLNVTLVYSANDASLALAIEAAGSEKAFIDKMNKKAKEIGAEHTHYISVNGFTELRTQTTTAKDIVKITEEALKNQKFRDIIKKTKYSLPHRNDNAKIIKREVTLTEEEQKASKKKYVVENGKTYLIEKDKLPDTFLNTNKLLYDKKAKIYVDGKERHIKYDGTFGIKTGTMGSSGYCLVAGAKREDTELISIVLDGESSNDRFADAVKMFEYGFNNFYTFKALESTLETGKVKVKYGHETKVNTSIKNDVFVTLPKEGTEELVDKKIKLYENVKAPIKKGTKVGEVQILLDKEIIAKEPILISKDIKKGGPWSALWISDAVAITILITIGILIILICLIRLKKKRAKEKNRRKYELAREKKALELAREREEKERRGWPY